jgi:LCP family protein required for cell wall assembly
VRQEGAGAFFHRFWTALVVVFVATVVLIAGSYAYAAHKVAQVPTVKIDSSVLQAGGNYLLIGSDSRAFVDTPGDQQAFGSKNTQTGQRSDTIMVAHVNSDGTGVLVSFPRDLWVAIPGLGHAKINAAFNYGPQRVIETIEQDFNVPISHYLEVDFEGFRNIVDKLGTIPIYFPTPARDKMSGLYINQAGCQHLNGGEALAYVRSRYYESLVNGQYVTDPLSDLDRIKRQQYFLRTLAQQVMHTAERKPWKAPDLMNALLANLQRDPKLNFSSLRALAYAFHPGGTQIPSLTLPTSPQTIDGQAALVLDSAQAAPLFAQLRGQQAQKSTSPPAGITPNSVQVAVENGSGRGGLGASTYSALQRAGFSVTGTARNADRSDYQVTEVRYAPGKQAQAQLVLSYLGGVGKAVALGSSPGSDVVLVIGQDFSGVSAPTSHASSNTSNASSPPTTAATSVNGATLPPAGC